MKKTLTVLALLLGAQISYGEWWSHKVSHNWTYGLKKAEKTADATTGDAASYTTYDIIDSGTLDSFTMKNGDVATIAQNKSNSNNADITIGSLIVAPATGDTGNGTASLVIDDAQKLKINSLTGSLSKVTVNGELTLGNGNTVVGINNFTLDADGIIKGAYNLGQQFTGDVTFTLSDADAITSTLSSLNNYEKTLVDGEVWNFEKISSFTLNVGKENTNATAVYLWNDTYYSDWTAGNQVTNNFDDADILPALAENTAYVVVKMNTTGKGVTGMSALITVPEPTTATLSLLALAGLAARRRRK